MSTETRLLDRIDREILRVLQNDARTSNRTLADRVGLAPSSCLARVQRLISEGVLSGFHAQVDARALGLSLQAMVFIQLATHGGSAIEAFRQRLLALPEVLQLFHVGGAQDLLVHVVVRDSDHLRRLISDGIASHEQLRHVETNVVFDHDVRPVAVELGDPERATDP
jgi:DNA-binding Lrp family transcriptional regulator